MREIKFRAWRDGVMYPGESLEVLLNTASRAGFELNAPTPVIWLQYTGLKDKNGVEIYEGDLLRLESVIPRGDGGCDDEIVRVCYCTERLCYVVDSGDYHDFLCCAGDHEGVVVGNIYENPELLGNQND